MSEAKPFASLSPSLLARKGAARPAMRSQLQPLGSYPGPESSPQFSNGDDPHEDLGWNDMGAAHEPEPAQGPATVLAFSPAEAIPAASVPEVVRQQDVLAEKMAEPVPVAVPRAPAEPSQVVPLRAIEARARRSALADGRRAAFTLRVDGDRHLKLRLACAVQGRSAQQVVTEALDQLLDALPEIDELARRVKRR